MCKCTHIPPPISGVKQNQLRCVFAYKSIIFTGCWLTLPFLKAQRRQVVFIWTSKIPRLLTEYRRAIQLIHINSISIIWLATPLHRCEFSVSGMLFNSVGPLYRSLLGYYITIFSFGRACAAQIRFLGAFYMQNREMHAPPPGFASLLFRNSAKSQFRENPRKYYSFSSINNATAGVCWWALWNFIVFC